MSNWKSTIAAGGILCAFLVIPGFHHYEKNPYDHDHAVICGGSHGCTFKTLFGEESAAGYSALKSSASTRKSIHTGLEWLIAAQQQDGGWGAGSHHAQHIRDPHAVQTDPATTAMVGMALLRTGNSLDHGEHSEQLRDALGYLLSAVEATPETEQRITHLTGTQIQTKLGNNIDAVLASQFFESVLHEENLAPDVEKRVRAALTACVAKIQTSQEDDGSLRGDGWAGVLQSSLANNVMEAAAALDIEVDSVAVSRSRVYQESNFDEESGRVNTERGAGVMLYALSGSVRASAKRARKAKKMVEQANREGLLMNEEVSVDALEASGLTEQEAEELMSSYQAYERGKDQARQEDVLQGFGNNGGEEFISFLQTGESLIIGDDEEWRDWYDDTAGRLLAIQNGDGSWSGHHCITSPVFCTATCLLILSIDRDIERLRFLADR